MNQSPDKRFKPDKNRCFERATYLIENDYYHGELDIDGLAESMFKLEVEREIREQKENYRREKAKIFQKPFTEPLE